LPSTYALLLQFPCHIKKSHNVTPNNLKLIAFFSPALLCSKTGSPAVTGIVIQPRKLATAFFANLQKIIV